MNEDVLAGPCDACSGTGGSTPDHHALSITHCGRALCRYCDCGGNCYERHIPSCDFCIEISNRVVVQEMTTEAMKSRNLLLVWRKETYA